MGMRFGRSCVISAVATVSFASALHAADLRWDADGSAGTFGTDGSGSWDLTTPNWNDTPATTNTAWVQGSNAVFGDPANTAAISADTVLVSVNSDIVANNIQLNNTSTGGAYTFDAPSFNSLTVNGNVIKNSNAGPVRFDLLGGPFVLGAGDHVFALRDTPGGGNPELAINANISGSGGLTLDNRLTTSGTKESWGTLSTTGINTYTGLTQIKYGRLVISQNAGLGSTSAGTVISEAGTLSVGGPGVTGITATTIAEPITITRNTYTGGDATDGGAFGHYGAAIISENGVGQTTFTGPFVVDSNDARIAAFTSTLTISSNITAGPNATAPNLGVTGDFAGFVHLTGNNTALTGGVSIYNAVELNVDNDNQIGGASAPLNFIGGGTYHPVNGYATSFGTHVLNNATFNGGIDVDDGQTFTINQALGRALGDDTNRVGSLGKRGTGTMNVNAAVNLRSGQTFWDGGIVNVNAPMELASLHLRSPTVNIGTGGSVLVVTGYNSFGSDSTGTNGGPDKATVNITGTGSFIQTSGDDFNISDNGNTEGTINLKDNGVLTTGGITFVGKSSGAKGTINQSGGTFTVNRSGDFAFVLADGRGGRTPTGTYNLSGGTFSTAGEAYVGEGSGGIGAWNQSGGTATISNWFVVGRESGSGDVDISGGTFIKKGGGNTPIGEGTNTRGNTFTVRNNATADFQTGEVWVSNGTTTTTMNIQNTATVNGNSYFVVGRFGGSNGILNLSGGSLNKGGANPFIVAAGGGSTGLYNQTGGVYNNTTTDTFVSDGGTATWQQSGGTANAGNFNIVNSGGEAGTVQISGTAVLNASNINVGQGGTGAATLNIAGGTVNSGTLSGGAGTGTKAFSFTAGTLNTGTFNVGTGLTNTGTGQLAPGGVAAVGSTAITGTYTQGATASASVNLGGSSAYDTVAVSGAASLAGTLNLSLVNGYVPAKLVGHTVLTASSVTGQFSTITGIPVDPSTGLAVTYSPTSVTVTAARFGDTDLNGTVNFTDLLALAKNYNQTSGRSWVTGDFTGDSAVNFTDLLLLAKNYGQSGASPAALPDGVSAQFASDWALAQTLAPEPTSVALLGLMGAFGVRRRRQH